MELAVLQAKLQSGELAPTDLVWREGMPEWTAAGDVAEVSGTPAPAQDAPVDSAAPAADAPMRSYKDVAPQAPATPATPATPASGGYQAPQGGIAPNMVAPPTSGLAIASMVCGIVGIMLCYVNGLLALPAVICGHMALKKIDNSLTPMGGRGMAIAGLVTGYIGLLFQLLFIALIFFAVAQEL